MKPLLQMILESQNGQGFDQIQRQFGLEPQKAERALEAVLPAFSTGLKRNTSHPMDFGAFMQAISSGRHAQYADDANASFSEEGLRDGNSILGHLFGSKDTSRAIAQQAAQKSGVSEDIIKKMLPSIATMVMGNVFKQSSDQAIDQSGDSQEMQAANISASNIGGGGILGQIFGELVKGGLNNKSRQRRGRGQKDNPLGDILEQMMGGSRQKQSRSRKNRDYDNDGDNPLGEIFENMLNEKRGNYQPREEQNYDRGHTKSEPDYYEDDGFEDIGTPQDDVGDGYYEQERAEHQPDLQRRRRPGVPASNRRGGGLEDLFGDMFETGQEVDEGYQHGVETIFDKFMKR